ncbi:MAG: GNAT family N-acetyltransferase [Treponemataceae bacterium]|nr:GNAT family N-acetyltransferase [Treponemataceae bacterium]
MRGERQPSDIRYRAAAAGDADEIMELVHAAISAMEAQGIFQWDRIYPAREDFLRDAAAGTLLLAVSGGQIAAVCAVNGECDEEYRNGIWRAGEPFAVVHRLCVRQEFQGRGIARAFLRRIEELLRERRFRAVRLDVFSKNPAALRLYEAAGYTRTGHADWRKGRFYLMEKKL